MAEKFVLGIDNGGTGSKAVLFDLNGREMGQARENTEMLTPRPGFTERDMDALWQVNARVIREAIRKAGVNPSDIISVSHSGHGKGLYLVGHDGNPVRNGIVSTDTRAFEYVDRWTREGIAARLYEKTCQAMLSCQPAALLKWLNDHEPGTLQKTKYVFGVKDYIRYRMTGEAFAEITDMSGSGLVNLHTKQYDSEILRLLGLAEIEDKLPPLADSFQMCGRLTEQAAKETGLVAGTPVAAGLFDIDACALAMNVVDDRYIASIAGTWSINEYLSKRPVLGHSVKMNSIYCIPGYYLAEECSPTSASNLEWFIQNFLKEMAQQEQKSLYDLANQVLDAPPSPQSIIFLPYVFGGMDDPEAKAAFVGMDASNTRADMLRSVYECIVLGHRTQIDRLLASRETPPCGIRLAGGIVNSPLWVQMFADVLQMPVETVTVNELGALGAAITAAVSAGCFASPAEAAGHMSHSGRTYLPNPAYAAVYEKKYRAFRAVNDALGGVWKQL